MNSQDALELADGLVFDKTGERLSDLQREILRASWSWERQNYDQIASTYGYSPNYIKKHVGPGLWKLLSDVLGEKITKVNSRSALERQLLQTQASSRAIAPMLPNVSISALRDVQTMQGSVTQTQQPLIPRVDSDRPRLSAWASHHSRSRAEVIGHTPYIDWGEAIAVEVLHGRNEELHTLQSWIEQDHCRLIGLFGAGGIGKTSLSVRLLQQIADACTCLISAVPFDFLIWRSLRSAPPLSELLSDLIQVLSHRQDTCKPPTIEEQISQLLSYLRQQRCLLVLDNGETILQSGDHRGCYRLGYEPYAELFRRVGEAAHQSCVILTSREKPKEIALLEGKTLPVRSLSLQGLRGTEGQKILNLKQLSADREAESLALVERYAGNPLVLKIVATTIQEIFDSNISEFLKQGISIFDGVGELLDQQYARLSALEKVVMCWLAIACEPISLEALREDIIPSVSQRQILESLKSLGRRSLIEKNGVLFTLQPVVMEYVLEKLIEQFCTELENYREDCSEMTSLTLWQTSVLIKAQAKDYVRETQTRLILEPVAKQLLSRLRTRQCLEEQVLKILMGWRSQPVPEPGYGAGNLLNLLHHVGTNLCGYDFSRLTVWQAYLADVNLQRVKFTDSDLSKSVLAETLAKPLSIAFSPDGERFATATSSGEICLWQTSDGKKRLTCCGHSGWVHSVAFSPDGNVLASGSEDETIRLWNTYTGQCLKTLRPGIWVWSVAFSPDGNVLASGSNDRLIRLWNVETGTCFKTLIGHTDWVRSVTFSPDGSKLASGSNDQTVKLWDIASGKCSRTFYGHTQPVQSVAFSPDNFTLASAGNDRTVRLWDVLTGECFNVLKQHTNWVQSIMFSPDSRTLVSGSNDQSVRLWDTQTGQCLNVLQGQTDDIWSVAFSPDGSTLVSGSSDQTVKIWSVASGQCVRTLQGYTDLVRSLAFNQNGATLANGSDDHTVKLWSVATGQCFRVLRGHANGVWSVAFSPIHSELLASGSNDHTVRIWNIHTGECLQIFRGHTSWVRSLAFSPTSNTLATGSTDQTIKLWDVTTGECLKTFIGHTNWIRSVAFSADGMLIASSSDDQTIRIWNSHSGECLNVLEGHQEGIWAIAFSTGSLGSSRVNQTLLASGSDDRTLRLWNVATGQCIAVLRGHQNWVRSVSFHPDGEHLVTASDDRTIKVWNVSTQACIQTLENQSSVWAIAHNPSGTMLASGGEDEAIKLWDQQGQCLKTLRAEKLYEGMDISGVKGLSDTQKATLRNLGARELFV